MIFNLSILDGELIETQVVNEIIKFNDTTKKSGLTLTQSQAVKLVKTRSIALKENGRVEFGGVIIGKLITEFYDSPFIIKSNYEETLHQLLQIFYYYKNETMDLISDDALIKYMKISFNGICQGSLDLLSQKELFNLARNLRYGNTPE